mmetsp:Transcript_9956/g.23343  ORF Transcript_9956/g.23343 Transcript_9956/m.23343 type:complete len:247 (-) Transcript_9956:622-1362(-)
MRATWRLSSDHLLMLAVSRSMPLCRSNSRWLPSWHLITLAMAAMVNRRTVSLFFGNCLMASHICCTPPTCPTTVCLSGSGTSIGNRPSRPAILCSLLASTICPRAREAYAATISSLPCCSSTGTWRLPRSYSIACTSCPIMVVMRLTNRSRRQLLGSSSSGTSSWPPASAGSTSRDWSSCSPSGSISVQRRLLPSARACAASQNVRRNTASEGWRARLRRMVRNAPSCKASSWIALAFSKIFKAVA